MSSEKSGATKRKPSHRSQNSAGDDKHDAEVLYRIEILKTVRIISTCGSAAVIVLSVMATLILAIEHDQDMDSIAYSVIGLASIMASCAFTPLIGRKLLGIIRDRIDSE
jgi:hypothetical protein